MVFETALTAPVFGLQRNVSRLLDEVLSQSVGRRAESWFPATDVREDAQSISIMLELPGISPDQVDVTSENGMLTIQGEKRIERKEGNDQQYHVVERSYGRFSRTFQLPKGTDESKISAEFMNGVLTITVPKAALPQPRKIAVSGGGATTAEPTRVNESADGKRS